MQIFEPIFWLVYLLQYFICSLYARGVVLGYRRGLRNQQPNTSLIKIEGVTNKKDTTFYLGKRIAYVYRAKAKRLAKGHTKPTNIRVMWGKVTKSHGNSGVVRAKFKKNLPPKAMGCPVRVVSLPFAVGFFYRKLHIKWSCLYIKKQEAFNGTSNLQKLCCCHCFSLLLNHCELWWNFMTFLKCFNKVLLMSNYTWPELKWLRYYCS